LNRCAQLQGSYRAISRAIRAAVAAECERFVNQHIEQKSSFAVETTLRTSTAILQAELAHARGFATALRFVATDSPDANVARVLQRGQGGGHGASERDVRAIYAASISNLARAITVFERVHVYDSTVPWTGPRVVATARKGQLTYHGASPAWLVRALAAAE